MSVRRTPLLLLIAIASSFPSTLKSQGIPWYTIPIPVPGGFVDVATLNVHLEIPLASVAERNGDPLVAKLIFDSPNYFFNYNAGTITPSGPGWRVFAGTSHSGSGLYGLE